MRDLLLMLFVLGSLPMTIMRPQYGLLVWAWLGYMNPHRLTWSYAYNFRFVYLVAIVCIIAIAINKGGVRRKIPITGTTVFWMLFTFWCTVTTIFAMNAGSAMWEWERTMKIQIMVAATFMLCQERVWLHRMVWVIVISIGFWGIKGGLFTLLFGGNYRVYGPMGTFFQDNNTLALAMITTFPLMRYLQLQEKNVFIRLGMWGLMGVTLFSILGTYSRGGFLGLGVMALAFLLKSRKRLLIIVALALLLPWAQEFMPEHWKERMGTIEHYEEDKSAMGRINAWHYAVNVAIDRPFLGAGFQGFTPALFEIYAPNPQDFHDAHSIFFEVLAEQGFVGFFLWFSMYILAFFSGTWVIRKTRERRDLFWARDMAAMLQVGLIGYAAAGSTLGLAYFDLPYHFMCMLVLVKQLVKRKLEQPQEEEAVEPGADWVPGASGPVPVMERSIFAGMVR